MTLGVASIGWAVFDGIDHLYEFADRSNHAKSLAELELASTQLARFNERGQEAASLPKLRPWSTRGGRPESRSNTLRVARAECRPDGKLVSDVESAGVGASLGVVVEDATGETIEVVSRAGR
ncbi:MAG: hypothetical protein JWN04_5874 [Myxococcaceae bacterium]|nr:hypothetical protein [Myxococcaceae bacterium]